jgi:hypothetical protein
MKIFFGFASTLSRSSFPVFVAWFVAVVLMCGFVVADRSAFAQEGDAVVPVVGSFGMGGSATGGVNEATGVFGVQVPVMGVPGVNDGGADLSVSYRQNSSETEEQGVGARWVWGVSRVVVDGGVKVFPASGGVFDADASTLVFCPFAQGYLARSSTHTPWNTPVVKTTSQQPGTLQHAPGCTTHAQTGDGKTTVLPVLPMMLVLPLPSPTPIRVWR